MEYTYKTTYKTHERDFNKTIGRLPIDFFRSKTVKLTLKSGIHATVQQALEIAEFIADSIEASKEQKIEFGLFRPNVFANNEFEITLKIELQN